MDVLPARDDEAGERLPNTLSTDGCLSRAFAGFHPCQGRHSSLFKGRNQAGWIRSSVCVCVMTVSSSSSSPVGHIRGHFSSRVMTFSAQVLLELAVAGRLQHGAKNSGGNAPFALDGLVTQLRTQRLPETI